VEGANQALTTSAGGETDAVRLDELHPVIRVAVLALLQAFSKELNIQAVAEAHVQLIRFCRSRRQQQRQSGSHARRLQRPRIIEATKPGHGKTRGLSN
jgi:hypothetical protein